VLNADDPRVAEMAAATDARVIYFATSPRNPIVAAHLAAGGWAVFVEHDVICLGNDDGRLALVELNRIPFTRGGKIAFQVQNALAATAAAWGAGLNPAMIARALTTFSTDPAVVPGRFNVTEIGGVQVVVDYGHNSAALDALAQAIKAFDRRRTLLLLGLPGDRRDEDLFATLDAIRPVVDEYVFYDLANRRGRDKFAVPRLLRDHLPATVRAELAENQEVGIRRTWSRTQKGDRLIWIVDEVDEAIAALDCLATSAAEEATCGTPIKPSDPVPEVTSWQVPVSR